MSDFDLKYIYECYLRGGAPLPPSIPAACQTQGDSKNIIFIFFFS
jgi:hypothetical protein